MSTELGRIEKPAAEQFTTERKIYLVPLVFSPPQPTKDYAEIYERYWTGVREQLLKLEAGIGAVLADVRLLPPAEARRIVASLRDRLERAVAGKALPREGLVTPSTSGHYFRGVQ